MIVCANGIGTPRLLLLSTSARFPDGLANSSGLVGKQADDAPVCGGDAAATTSRWKAGSVPAGQTIQSMQFYETDTARGFVRGAKWQVMPTGGPLGMRAAYGGKPLEEAWGAEPAPQHQEGVRPRPSSGASSPRICRRSATRSCSTQR